MNCVLEGRCVREGGNRIGEFGNERVVANTREKRGELFDKESYFRKHGHEIELIQRTNDPVTRTFDASTDFKFVYARKKVNVDQVRNECAVAHRFLQKE